MINLLVGLLVGFGVFPVTLFFVCWWDERTCNELRCPRRGARRDH